MSYQEMIDHLNWFCEKEAQVAAINELVDLVKLKVVTFDDLFPMTKKSMWENYCKAVEEVGAPESLTAVNSLLFLLKDVNWPGAQIALEVLSGFDRVQVLDYLEQTIKIAYAEKDSMWLGGMKMLINRMNICNCEFSDDTIVPMLNEADF